VLQRRPARAVLWRERNAGLGAGPPGDADDRNRRSQRGAQLGRGRSTFRTDIQGLRAVAVLVVVAYHAGVPGISGGYVGVDVFFVISGFLITGLLWQELAATGALSLTAFYARRIRRLLPAAVLVLVATLGASWLWLAPLRVPSVARDAAAAALYAANYRFAVQGTDYLSAQAPPSPVQHFWSLGVEEQFYLLWPVLLVLAAAAVRPARLTRVGAAWGLGALGAGSLALSLVLTDRAQPWAFYSLPTRAWELAGGGVLALAVPPLRRLPRPVATAVGWSGLCGIGWAVVADSAHTQYPGTAALLPVAGAMAVIAAGCARPRWGPDLLLARRPMQETGRLSYSLYLWHWPVLIIGGTLVHGPLGRAALVGLSVMLAAGAVRLVEDPARGAGGLVRVPARALALGAALTATAVLAATGAAVGAPVPTGSGPAAAVAALGAPARAAAPSAASRAVRPEPFPGLGAEQLPVLSAVAQGAAVKQVPVNLTPALTAAHGDAPLPFRDGCDLSFTAEVSPPCVYGDSTATTRVVAFGDSHAAQWFPALDGAAVQDHWKLENLTKATCPPLLLPLLSPDLGRTFRECESWRTSVLARITAERPALVILDMARHYGPEYHFTVYNPDWVNALADMVRRLRSTGARVLVIGPTPKPPDDVPYCLAGHLANVPACTAPLVDEVNLPGSAAERVAVLRAGGAYLDVAPWVCTLGRCADIVGNLLVFRDDNHFTAEYPAWLTPLIATVVRDQLRAHRPAG